MERAQCEKESLKFRRSIYSSQSGGLTSLTISYSDIDGGATALENYENITLNIGDGILNENKIECDCEQ